MPPTPQGRRYLKALHFLHTKDMLEADLTSTILDIIHRFLFYLKRRFGDWIQSLSSSAI
jgi:hypothetical protein